MKLFMTLALLLLTPALAMAQTNYPVLAWERLTLGASIGVRSFDEDRAYVLANSDGPQRFGLNTGAQLAYSAGPAIAFGGSADFDPEFEFGRAVFPAINFAIASDGTGGHGVQLFMRAGLAHYYGENADEVLRHEADGVMVDGKKTSLELALPLSWQINRSANKKHAFFIGVDPRVDLHNSLFSIVGRLQYGLTPVPPQ